MTAYTTRMPSGFVGRVTRSDSLTIETAQVDAATPPTAYGVFVKLVAGKIQPIASADAASVVYGLLVNSFPAQSVTNSFGNAVPPVTGLSDILRRGYMSVALARGTAVKGAQVFVRITAAAGPKLVGEIETTASAGECVAVPFAFFNGPADSNGVVEISYSI